MQSLEETLPPKLRKFLAEGNAIRQVIFVGESIPQGVGVEDIEAELMKGRYKLPHFLHLGSGEKPTNLQSVGIDSYVQSLTSACIIPFIEDRIRELEVVISACRRGLKNQLKSFLFRKTPSEPNIPSTRMVDIDVQSSSGTNMSIDFLELKSNSVEAAMRQQSDLLLMVGDYTTAVSTLKLLSSDLKSDKLYFHFASAQECLAIAHLTGGISISSAIIYVKEAFIRYAALVDAEDGFWRAVSSMYCTRVAMQWAGLLFAMDRFSEASWIVMRAHFYEGNLRAAMLLQYSAFCLMQQKPQKQRKHSFHLVLAALRYSQANQSKIASLLHKDAIQVLQGKGWDILEEHIHEALDHEYNDSGESSKALSHAVAMLQCHNLPASIQAKHMSHLLGLYQTLQGNPDAFPIELELPVFGTSHLSIVSSGSHDYHDAGSREVSNKIWKDMESYLPKRGTVHSRASSAAGSKHNIFSSCAGEDITVTIPVRNPLKIELELSEIKLICSMKGKSKNSLSTSIERLHLYAGEVFMLSLICRPLDSGTLTIDGLSWNVANMPCRKIFAPSISKWAIDTKLREPKGGSIEFDILPPMPRLHCTMCTLPEELVVGEIVECEMEFSSEGSIGLCNIESVFSQNVFLADAVIEEMNDGAEYSKCRYTDISLGVSEKRTVKAYFRPERPGHQSFRIIWRYEPTLKPAASSGSRVLRFSKTIYVKPSLNVLPALVSKGEDQTLLLQVHQSEYINSVTMKTFYDARDGENLLKISLQESKTDSVDYELTTPLSCGTLCQLKQEFLPQELYFFGLNLVSCGKSLDSNYNVGVLCWNATVQGREARGLTCAAITTDVDMQSMLGQLCGPASLNHNFSKGPLVVNLELRITSNVGDIVDACLMVGNSQSVNAPRLMWKGKICGMQHDIQPGEKRFIILEAIVDRPGMVHIDSIYVNWNSRSSQSLVGSFKIEPSSIRVRNVTQ